MPFRISYLRLMAWLGVATVVVSTILPMAPAPPASAQTTPPVVELNEDIIKRATVFIMQTFSVNNQPMISCVGSGTLVSADGLILTNAHSALPSEACPSDAIAVAITVRPDEPPIPTYTAELVDASTGLDLAVLRISGYLDGRLIPPGSLQLPFVELGDSLSVELDNTITVVGYPSFGNDPVEVTRGTVSGFTAEARAGDRAWIRTSAVIPGTMSGGGAYNRDGQLIGIPTIAPARAGGEAVDCRYLQDTNLDGRADSSDHCIPVGGFISALRPSRLARGLLRAAALGIRQGEQFSAASPAAQAAGPAFSRLFFSTRINEVGQPSNVVSTVPAGTTSLYLFFDYANLTDGLVYELRVTVDNIQDAAYSLPPATWSGGSRGTWYIGTASVPLRNGLYDFRLYIEGREAASQRIVVGGGPPAEATFSDIIFGLLDSSGTLVGTSYVLPEGSTIQARFNYRNMQPETPWSYIWYFEGRELARDTTPWDGDQQGTRLITAAADFLAGQYRLELYIDGVLNATADFVIAGAAESARATVFTNFRFTTDRLASEPSGVIRNDFPTGIDRLYAFFDWRLLAPGTMWTRRWLVDGEVLYEVTEPWTAPSQGENYFVSLSGLATLPDATYELEISIANVTRQSVSARVGLGQLPVGVFASAAGVQMIGRITDADTQQGIPGAMFIVLKSEYSVEDFLWNQSQVLGISLADSEGRFQIPILLPRGTEEDPLLYSVMVQAEGYLPLSADGIPTTETTVSPIEINAALSRN